MLRKSFFISALLASLLLAAPAMALAAPLPVVASIPPQKYLLERIAGDAVIVSVLLKPGADPHTYEPSPAQMRVLASATAWFTIGVPFEDVWIPRISGTTENFMIYSSIRGIKRLPFQDQDASMEELDRMLHTDGKEPASATGNTHEHVCDEAHPHIHEIHDHAHGGEDPHVWLSPMLIREIARGMARDLGNLLPEKAVEFDKQAEALAEELEELDRELNARFQTVPADKRVFLTFHPSWRYFAHDYGLIELSIETEGKEPSPRSLEAVADLARQVGIRTVFMEPQFPKNAAKAVAEAIGADVVVVNPLEEDLLNLFRNMADKLMATFTS